MEDVVKKRVVGAVVLVILGILLPLLLARCMRDDAAGDASNMRVYEITPAGEARPADQPQPVDAGERPENDAGPDAAVPAVTAPQPSEEEPPPAEPMAPEAQRQAPEPAPIAPEAQPQTPEPEPQPESESPAPEPAPPSASAEPVEPSEQTAPALKRTATEAGWVVQVASFSDESNALALARELNDGYPAFYTEATVGGNTYYRVRIGPFDDEAAANATAEALRAQGRSTLVQQVE